METELVAAASSNGSLSSVGSSLLNVGTATKALALAHPIGMATAGGALLGVGVYFAASRMFRKKSAPIQTEAVAA